jgi:hypothetical protein
MAAPRAQHRRIVALLLVVALSAAAVPALLTARAESGTPHLGKLGVTYGPYLGRRCRHAHRGCGLVGIDVVLGRAATRVEATAGSQTIRLRTPGEHNGVRRRDWVGTFTRTGFARTPRPHHDLVYTPVELHVHFTDGREARALFPHVLVAPGWG